MCKSSAEMGRSTGTFPAYRGILTSRTANRWDSSPIQWVLVGNPLNVTPSVIWDVCKRMHSVGEGRRAGETTTVGFRVLVLADHPASGEEDIEVVRTRVADAQWSEDPPAVGDAAAVVPTLFAPLVWLRPGRALRLIVKGLLGLRWRADGLVIDPVLPTELDGLQATVMVNGVEVHACFSVAAPGHGVRSVKVNGATVATTPAPRRYRQGGVHMALHLWDEAAAAGGFVQIG